MVLTAPAEQLEDHRRTDRRWPAERAPRAVASAMVGAGALVTAGTLGRLLMTGNPFDHMWGEDGPVFLGRGGHLGALFESYAGYALLVPRLIAAVGAQLPVAAWAAFAVIAAALAVGALAGFVRYAAEAVTGSVLTAWVAAASLALTPALMYETLGSLANLQWFLLAAALWAFFLPLGRGGWAAAVVTGLTAATTPLIVLLLPGAVLVHRHRVWRAPAVWGTVVGGIYQLAVIRFGSVAPGGPVRHRGIPTSPVAKVLDYAAGVNVSGHVLAALTAVAVAFLWVLGLWAARGLRLHVAASAATSVGLLAVVSYLSGDVASRYVAGASLLAAAGVAVVVGACGRWALPGAAVVAVATFVALPAAPIKFAGPTWSQEVAAWHTACAQGAVAADIPVSPSGWGAVTVPCG